MVKKTKVAKKQPVPSPLAAFVVPTVETANLPASPADAQLATAHYLKTGNERYSTCVRFTCPEFTCLCPITKQPDTAIVVIDYIPRQLIVESASLKMFMLAYRNFAAFHETIIDSMGRRILNAVDPVWLRIGGYFFARDGIPIDVFYSYGKMPEFAWIPNQDVAPYRGR